MKFPFFRTVLFYTTESKKVHVISGSDDGRIYIHNLHASGTPPTILQGHMSTVTSLVLHNDHTLIRYKSSSYLNDIVFL